jgi:hypothetical protein
MVTISRRSRQCNGQRIRAQEFARLKNQRVIGKADTQEAEHDCLPKAPLRTEVNPAGRVTHVVVEVYVRRQLQVAFSHFELAKAGG